MSGFQKPAAGAILDYSSTRSLHDAASYSTYGQSPYVTSLVPSPMADQTSQVSDCVPYVPGNDYGNSFDEVQSPMMNARSRRLPEIVIYSPHRGSERTRVMVQVQSPYDLHNSVCTLFVVFGTKKCQCNPTFMGFEGSTFQYQLNADAPPFISTGSPSFAVPVQVVMETQGECPPITLQVGVYTYEQVAQVSASTDSRKRKFSSYSDDPISVSAKRPTGPVVPKVEPLEAYSCREARSGSFSPYVPSLPAMIPFAGSYHTVPPPRNGPGHYAAVSAPSQSSLRAHSPATSAWSSSYTSLAQHVPRHAGPSPVRASNPTLIRTSTLQQSSNMGHNQGFNPYAMYPSKAILKLNGELDAMAEGWSKQERESQRRLVQFTRSQTGSTIHADFKPVTPDERAPNSICISCILWEERNECYVTSVDTIYLLESLVAVRFTVEEKNRIRRNLEGFRPLTISKAKADSEEFFKVIMGFPAPKPRNIEKDVKVFPWKILSHALKKIIGKYSASYSSTAGALPTPITNYTSHGTGSDSGTEPHTVPSPQSISDSGPGSSYATSLGTQIYSIHPDPAGASLTAAPDLRSVMPQATQPYTTIGSCSSYPAICQPQSTHGLLAPTPRALWDLQGTSAMAPSTSTTSSVCYSYIDPVYPLHDAAHGP